MAAVLRAGSFRPAMEISMGPLSMAGHRAMAPFSR
jgi:hypothetical protein